MENQKQDDDKRLSCVIRVRVGKHKYNELTKILDQARGIHSLSHLVRVILDNKPIIVQSYDATQDKVIAALSGVRTELRSIGININQVTREFNQSKSPDARLARALEVARLFQQTEEKMAQLFTIISNLATQWLPKS